MCLYRKALYQCNHSIIGITPLGVCPTQKDYESGVRSEACNIVETQPRNTVKVPRLCTSCHERKVALDQQFDSVKKRLAKLKEELKERHHLCVEHLNDVGLEPEERLPSSDGLPDPIEEFLKKKRLEKDAHLMMFW
ncbi:hypothetical protein F4804DRAFT_329750 [Jackrogersella minutella]|nr:hypothetical protein F4804DRAFT_329750 [Jackrogersella minutella]